MPAPIEFRAYYKPLAGGLWHKRTPFKVEDGYVHYRQDTEDSPQEEFLVPIRSWHHWAKNTLRDEETVAFMEAKRREHLAKRLQRLETPLHA